MQSEVINLSGLSRKMKVTVPPELIKDEFNKRISELAKKANIKGFRKGKVPTTVVKLQYGDAVRQEVIQDVLWQTLQQAFKEQNLYPAGTPEIELKNIKEDAPFEYEASFEVYPEVKLDLQGISVERPVSEVTDQHVTDVIAKLRKQNTKWSEVERGAEKGDLLVVDFEGFIDDVKFEGGSANNFQLELGGGQMIPGFEDSLYGAKKDDDVLVNVTFPEDYHAPEAAGKPAKFKIKIQKVSEPQLPEVNDDFAKDLGVSDGTIEGLSKEVRQNLERELTKRIHDRIKEQIINAVIENNSVEVPQTLIDKEAARLQQQFQKQWAMQTGQKNAPALPAEQFKEQSRKNVILGLLLSQWIEENKINVDKEKVKARIEEIASGYHQPQEIIGWYYSNKEALSELEAMVLEEQAIDLILEKVKVVDKPTSFDEIMNPPPRGEE